MSETEITFNQQNTFLVTVGIQYPIWNKTVYCSAYTDWTSQALQNHKMWKIYENITAR